MIGVLESRFRDIYFAGSEKDSREFLAPSAPGQGGKILAGEIFA
jgi:hypothetical protein